MSDRARTEPDCPYGCAGGWLPLPGLDEETACPHCNDYRFAEDEEPEVGMSFEGAVRLLGEVGAAPHEYLPDYWTLVFKGREHTYRLVELGADTWRIEDLSHCPLGCCWELAPTPEVGPVSLPR